MKLEFYDRIRQCGLRMINGVETGHNHRNPYEECLGLNAKDLLTQKTTGTEGCLPSGVSALSGRGEKMLGGHARLSLTLGSSRFSSTIRASHLAGMGLLACSPAEEPTPPGSQGDLLSLSSHATFSEAP